MLRSRSRRNVPEVVPMNKVRVRPAIAVPLGLLTLIAGLLGVGYLSRLPTLNDPVRVEVIDGGSALSVAVNPCLGFNVTEVKVVTGTVKGNVAADADTTVWDIRPHVATQTIFQTGRDNSTAIVPFHPLTTYPASNVFGVYVYYAPQSAPKGFTDRTALTRSFALVQSTSEVKAYQKVAAASCK